jgi:hypothetical protein
MKPQKIAIVNDCEPSTAYRRPAREDVDIEATVHNGSQMSWRSPRTPM